MKKANLRISEYEFIR